MALSDKGGGTVCRPSVSSDDLWISPLLCVIHVMETVWQSHSHRYTEPEFFITLSLKTKECAMDILAYCANSNVVYSYAEPCTFNFETKLENVIERWGAPQIRIIGCPLGQLCIPVNVGKRQGREG